MTVSELFQQGQLDEAIEVALRDVKSSPLDVNKRLLLCDLLSVAHHFERADKQLDTLSRQDPELAVGISLYRNLVRAATARADFYESGRVPEFMEDVPETLKLHLRASIAIRDGQIREASELLEEAESQRTPLGGECDGQPFSDFRDLDDLTAPFLEVLTSTGKYYWVSWDRISEIEFRAPRLIRDLLWRPANMSIHNGPDAVVYVPVLYAGSHSSSEPGLRCGQSTDWTESDGGPVRGLGQRMFLVGEDDRPFLTVQKISFTGHENQA